MDDFIFGNLSGNEHVIAQMKAADTGVKHLGRREPAVPSSGESTTLWLRIGSEARAEAAYVYYTVDGSLPAGQRGQATNGQVLPLHFSHSEFSDLLWRYTALWQVTIPAQPDSTYVRYVLEAVFPEGAIYADSGAANSDAATVFGYWTHTPSTPEWIRSAIIYHIFLDRFAAADGHALRQPRSHRQFAGGNLGGVLAKLDYLSDLGVNCLYLSPLMPSPTPHGYDATDYYNVEPRLGTLALVRQLTAEAHRRGMRLVLDFVPNHISNQHPYFVAATANRESEYTRWFTFRNWPGEYAAFFNASSMPQINLAYPAARKYLIDAARFWLSDVGFDGLRLDYANGPSHDFWADFSRQVHVARPDAYLAGEVVEAPPVVRSYAGYLDGNLDFPLVYWLRRVFALDKANVAEFDAFMQLHDVYFPRSFVMPAFLNNHDMNRFLWMVRGNKQRLRLGALALFTQPGPPIIYYGDEVGLNQQNGVREAGDNEARRPMLWGPHQDRDLRDYFKRLVQLRRAQPAIWQGERYSLWVNAAESTYAYGYRGGDGRMGLIAVLNNSPRLAQVQLNVGPEIARQPWVDLLNNHRIESTASGLKLTLAGYDGAWLQMKN